MTDKKTFKGFSLNSSGDVLGAFPTVDIIQERAKDLMNEVTGNINQMTIDYCLKFNIDPDVLIKQKAEIELLQMKNKELKETIADIEKNFRICESNADTCYDQLTKAKEILRSLRSIIQYRIDYKNNIGIADEMWRAEQFLKEIEK